MYHTGKITTNTKGKCGSCKYYEPKIKKDNRMKIMVEYCNGKCLLATDTKYRQRTESCKKFESKD